MEFRWLSPFFGGWAGGNPLGTNWEPIWNPIITDDNHLLRRPLLYGISGCHFGLVSRKLDCAKWLQERGWL